MFVADLSRFVTEIKKQIVLCAMIVRCYVVFCWVLLISESIAMDRSRWTDRRIEHANVSNRIRVNVKYELKLLTLLNL